MVTPGTQAGCGEACLALTTCFGFLRAEDVTGIATEIATHRARDRQEKLAHPSRPVQQRRALIKIVA